jgi:bifunctional DNA-binding transcriptional regulator/antitoxin component of YhaV-PrlF toxin-antitoxin module
VVCSFALIFRDADYLRETATMATVKIKGNQLTLPDDLRQALTSADDDLIDAEEVEQGVLLRRSPAARRNAALRQIRSAQRNVRYKGSAQRPSADEEERKISELLAADNVDRRAQKRR